MPQHHVYKNELNCECYNVTLARRNIAPWWWSKKVRNMSGVILIVLSVFMWNLCKCNCWLIIEVILGNARCNNKVYMLSWLKLLIKLLLLHLVGCLCSCIKDARSHKHQISERSCRENQNTHFKCSNFFPNSYWLWHNVGKYDRTRRATVIKMMMCPINIKLKLSFSCV